MQKSTVGIGWTNHAGPAGSIKDLACNPRVKRRVRRRSRIFHGFRFIFLNCSAMFESIASAS